MGGGFTGRFWRVVLDQVTANLIEITASEHTISRTAEHIKAQPEPYYPVLFQVRGSSMFWLLEVPIGDVAARWGTRTRRISRGCSGGRSARRRASGGRGRPAC
jgi:hypothetical protein